MTMNLITGKAGAPHITSSDQGAMQAGLVGNGNYLLQGGDGKFPAVTMQSANKALVPVLNLVIEGRYARVTAAETVTIESGVTGRNRNDLICVKYTRDSNNIETIALAVLKGTATSGTAADPTVPSGSILNNSGTVWIPIARIPISGITAGTPVMLVKQLPPMSQLWDSVALTATFKFQDTGSFVGALYGGSNTITVKGNMLYVDLSSFKSTVEISNYRVWLYQSGIRPSATIGLGCVGSSLADPHYNKQANWNPDGSITLLGGIGRENILIQRFSMPIPSGVTFS